MNRVAAILGLLVSLAASAWAQPGTGLPPAGFDVLAGVLNFHRVTPMTVEQAIESNDDRLLLVILGRTAPGERLRLANLSRRILAAGGAVLIATDESLQLTAFLRDGAAFQVTGEKIRCNREEFLWANNPLCPFLKPRPLNTARLALASDETALLFTDLDRVAVNLSSRLTAPEELGDDWQRLADLPIGSLTLGEGEALSRTNRLFAAAGSGRFGGNAECRMLLLADAGLLTNQMLAPTAGLPDNDNLALADRIVLWMQGNPNRTRACVVVDGTALTQFDGVPLTMLPPIPPLPLPDPLDPAVQAKLAQAFNETLGKFERNDGFNRLLIGGDETSRPIRLRRLLLSLAVALGIFLLIVGVQRIRSRVHQPQSDLMPAERLDAKVVKLAATGF